MKAWVLIGCVVLLVGIVASDILMCLAGFLCFFWGFLWNVIEEAS